MNKVWLYVGGVIVGPTVSIYAAITTVKSTHPPASDQRTAYETAKQRTLYVECIVSDAYAAPNATNDGGVTSRGRYGVVPSRSR